MSDSNHNYLDMSEKLKSALNQGKSQLPFAGLAVGKSFCVPYSGASNPSDPVKSFKTLRSKASAKGKRMGRKFRVFDHGPEIGFEVGRYE